MAVVWQSYDGSMVDRYVRYLVPAVFLPWADDLVVQAAPRAGESVLDIACGPGVVARLAAERVGEQGRVVGLDVNPEMLEAARSVSASDGITWQEGSAVALPFADSAFDLVLCQQGLQFIPDRLAALGEMSRVLLPGGRLALSVWAAIERNPGWWALEAARRQHDTPESVAILEMAYSLADEDELARLVESTGFMDVEVRTVSKITHFPGIGAMVLGTAGSTLAETSPLQWQALLAELTEKLRPYSNDGGLELPTEAHVITARRSPE